jgi:hypothetical protein
LLLLLLPELLLPLLFRDLFCFGCLLTLLLFILPPIRFLRYPLQKLYQRVLKGQPHGIPSTRETLEEVLKSLPADLMDPALLRNYQHPLRPREHSQLMKIPLLFQYLP